MLYHHRHVLHLAKKAYERAVFDKDESFVSITLSAMALECYINDFTQQSSNEFLGLGVRFLENLNYVLRSLETSRASLIEKIRMIHFLLLEKKIDMGSKQYQDLAMLVRLRNELVHRKPESTGEWGVENNKIFEPHKFVKYFSDRGVIDLPSEELPPVWSQHLNKPDVAKWAYNTVVSTIKDVVRILPESYFSQIQNTMIDGLKEI